MMTTIEIDGAGQVTDRLFIGGTRAYLALEQVYAAGIRHILKLYFGNPQWPAPFHVHELPMDDGVFIAQDVLQEGVAFIHDTMTAGYPVLVLCGLGISRSSTFVLATLLEEGYDLHEAFRLLRAARPQAWPMRELWASLLAHYATPYTLDDVMRWQAEM